MREIVRQITDPLGFHIQLAVLLAGEAQRWRSRVTFMHEGRAADASDLMALLSRGGRSGEAGVVPIEGVAQGAAAAGSVRGSRTGSRAPRKTRVT